MHRVMGKKVMQGIQKDLGMHRHTRESYMYFISLDRNSHDSKRREAIKNKEDKIDASNPGRMCVEKEENGKLIS